MTMMSRLAACAAVLGAATLAAASPSEALSMRGPGGRSPGGFRHIDPGIGNGGGGRHIDPGIGNGQPAGWSLPRGHTSRRTIIGGHGNGPDPQPLPQRWRNRQGGLLGGLNQAPTGLGGYYHCHPRRWRMGLC